MATKGKPKAPKPTEILLAEGAVYFNLGVQTKEVEVGALGESGSTFKLEVEYTDPNFHGKRGPVKGLRQKKTAKPVFTFNALQLSTDKLAKYYAGLSIDSATSQEYDIIKGRKIQDSDYLDNVAFVGRTQDGKEVAIIVKNALGDGSLEMAFDGKESVVTSVQYTGHYLPESLDDEPWEIHWAKVAQA